MKDKKTRLVTIHIVLKHGNLHNNIWWRSQTPNLAKDDRTTLFSTS